MAYVSLCQSRLFRNSDETPPLPLTGMMIRNWLFTDNMLRHFRHQVT
jgi:hypothetical protein